MTISASVTLLGALLLSAPAVTDTSAPPAVGIPPPATSHADGGPAGAPSLAPLADRSKVEALIHRTLIDEWEE